MYEEKVVADLKEYVTRQEDAYTDIVEKGHKRIEHIEKDFKMLCGVIDLINHQKADIERLQKENHCFAEIGKMYSEIKAEVTKEFAERLKSKKHICLPPIGYPVDENDWVIYEYDIDETYKEMAGEDK